MWQPLWVSGPHSKSSSRHRCVALVTFNFIQAVYKWLQHSPLRGGGGEKCLWKKVFARLSRLWVSAHRHYLLPSFNDFPPRGAAARALAVGLRIALDARLSGHYTHCNMQLTRLLHFHYTIIHSCQLNFMHCSTWPTPDYGALALRYPKLTGAGLTRRPTNCNLALDSTSLFTLSLMEQLIHRQVTIGKTKCFSLWMENKCTAAKLFSLW